MSTADEVDAGPESIAAEFHVASRNQAAYKRNFKAHDVHSAPAIRKLVTDAPLRFEDRPRVLLPHRDEPVEGTVLDAIKRRASGRAYRGTPLPAGMLATMLRHANGVLASLDSPDGAFYRRAAANAGDLGSVEIYPIVFNVDGIDQGIYHFDSVSHDLTVVRRGRFADWFREVVVYQPEFAAASAALVLTSAVGRLQEKYGARGYRFGLLDVGHVSQNLYLVGAGLRSTGLRDCGFHRRHRRRRARARWTCLCVDACGSGRALNQRRRSRMQIGLRRCIVSPAPGVASIQGRYRAEDVCSCVPRPGQMTAPSASHSSQAPQKLPVSGPGPSYQFKVATDDCPAGSKPTWTRHDSYLTILRSGTTYI